MKKFIFLLMLLSMRPDASNSATVNLKKPSSNDISKAAHANKKARLRKKMSMGKGTSENTTLLSHIAGLVVTPAPAAAPAPADGVYSDTESAGDAHMGYTSESDTETVDGSVSGSDDPVAEPRPVSAPASVTVQHGMLNSGNETEVESALPGGSATSGSASAAAPSAASGDGDTAMDRRSTNPADFDELYKILDGEAGFKEDRDYLAMIEDKESDFGISAAAYFYKMYGHFCLMQGGRQAQAAAAYHRILKLDVTDCEVTGFIKSLGLNPDTVTQEKIKSALP